MRLDRRDAFASVLVALILVPYIGYLIRGEMPFIQDPRGMAATGLVLGAAAFLVADRVSVHDAVGRVEVALAVTALTVGVAALLLAETVVAEALLAAFIAMIVIVWTVKLLHHAGVIQAERGGAIGLPR
jgi:steroid 5-alpha reductase family enzyme